MAQKRRQPEVIAGRVNADGSIAAGDGFTVTFVGAGQWTLAFPASFRPLAVVVTVAADTVMTAIAVPLTPSSYNVRLYTPAAAAGAQPWNFVAVGAQQ